MTTQTLTNALMFGGNLSTSMLAGLQQRIVGMVTCYRQAQKEKQTRIGLKALDNHMLQDIGLTRGDLARSS